MVRIGRLFLQRAGGQAFDELTLQQHEEHHRRERENHPGSEQTAVIGGTARTLHHIKEAQSRGLAIDILRQDQREQHVAPGPDEDVYGYRDDACCREGQRDTEERTDPATTVDHRLLFERNGEGGEEAS